MLQRKLIDQATHHVQDSTKNRGIPAYDIDFREASRGIAMHHRHRICHRARPRSEGAIGT